jgi:hypothetical protein
MRHRFLVIPALAAVVFLVGGCSLFGCGAAATNGASFASCRTGASF